MGVIADMGYDTTTSAKGWVVRAKELMFSGRVVRGEEAAQIGLANQCVPDTSLLDSGLEMARSFLENSWFTLRADKMLNGGLDHTT